jgi:hypothetical protein
MEIVSRCGRHWCFPTEVTAFDLAPLTLFRGLSRSQLTFSPISKCAHSSVTFHHPKPNEPS